VGTTLGEQVGRYDAVIHLRTPTSDGGYHTQNPLRVEAADEAASIDEEIADAWAGHPRRFLLDATPDFLTKASQALTILREEVPACCRGQVLPIP
jgi:hypothetical protein